MSMSALKNMRRENEVMFDILIAAYLRSAVKEFESTGECPELNPAIMSMIRARLRETARISDDDRRALKSGQTALDVAMQERMASGDLSDVLGRIDGQAREVV